MRRWVYIGAIVLPASLGLPGYASAKSSTKAADFSFSYVSAYGTGGLSQPYAGPTTTGQSYGTGVAVDPDGPGQQAYSLVEANANVGVGGCRGCFPASSGTPPPSSTSPSYLGPYYIVRRTSHGAIDTEFGADGYINAFDTSDEGNYKFTSLCIAPPSRDIIIVQPGAGGQDQGQRQPRQQLRQRRPRRVSRTERERFRPVGRDHQRHRQRSGVQLPGHDPFGLILHQGNQAGLVLQGDGPDGSRERSHRRPGHQLQRHRRTDQRKLRRSGPGPHLQSRQHRY